MELSPLLVNLGAGVVLFAVLLIGGAPERRRRATEGPGEVTEIVVVGLASVNITGVLVPVSLAAEMLYDDGIMDARN